MMDIHVRFLATLLKQRRLALLLIHDIDRLIQLMQLCHLHVAAADKLVSKFVQGAITCGGFLVARLWHA